MPLVENYGYVNIRRNGVLVPASAGGSWLRTTFNGFSDYRSLSHSFYRTSSWGSILQDSSILVDIPLVDRSFYGKKTEAYKEELKIVGVMFEFNNACEFAGNHLMSLAKTSSFSRANVFSILKFIRHLRKKLLSPESFIRAIKNHPWLRKSSGDRSLDGVVLFNQDCKVASLISDIPFIDRVINLNLTSTVSRKSLSARRCSSVF
ncbi:unnamed protein product [Arabis nemorensis]|uniref:Uncharacterized protein n=1 Tax=Arabis nemorensis TaxID=586526 RepID=A0A565BBB6_9BRAS|nr:unnamed protein product [Arabis nemorensis]